MINEIPCFPSGYKFNEKFEVSFHFLLNCSFQIVERIGWDDSIGATYFVKPLDEKYPIELVMRVDKVKDKNTILPTEVLLLKEVCCYQT